MERIPASERTREKLKAMFEGSSDVGGTSELVRLAARLMIEEALEGEARDALGRDYYARGAAPARATATAIARGDCAARRGRSNTARRRLPTALSRSARRFASSCAGRPPSWRRWRWRCTRAGCRPATSRRYLRWRRQEPAEPHCR